MNKTWKEENRLCCSKCKEVKDRYSFFKNKARKTGRDNLCKLCRGGTPSAYHTKTCIMCEKEYKAKNKDAKYCSRACFNTGVRFRPLYQPCLYCNKRITQTRARRKKFCDQDCNKIYQSAQAITRSRRRCDYCDTIYWGKNMYKRRFCDLKCSALSQRANEKVYLA